MLLMMQLIGNVLVGLFVHEAEVIELGGQALKITSVFYVFLGLIYVTRGVLNGIGDAFFSLLNGVVEITGRVGLPLLLVRVFSPDFWERFEKVFGLHRLMVNPPSAEVWSIWITAGLTWVIAESFCTLRYLSWKKKAGRSRTARAASGGPA